MAAATAGIAITAFPAGAAEPPSAPYDVLTATTLVNAATTNVVTVIEGDTGTFTNESSGDDVKIRAIGAGRNATIQIRPMPGDTLAEGTFPVQDTPAGSIGGFKIAGYGATCTALSGSVTISELHRDAETQALTALAATYSITCDGSRPTAGELRWHSAIGYVARAGTTTNINFGAVSVGYPAAPQPLTVTSMGTLPLVVGTVTVSGVNASQFPISSDGCTGTTLAYGQSCTVYVGADPTGTTIRTALVTITDNTAIGRQTTLVSVTGTNPFGRSVQPTQLMFEGTAGLAWPSQTVTVRSNGDAPLVLGTASLTGSNPEVFTIAQDLCSGTTLTKGQTCTIQVGAGSATKGGFGARLSIPDNSAPLSPQLVTLSALARSRATATQSTAAIAFGAVPVGDVATQTVTVTSTGLDPLVFEGMSIQDGDHTFSVSNNTCEYASVAPGSTCTVDVHSRPTAMTSYSATLFLRDNTDERARIINLTATGVLGTNGTYYPVAPTRIMDTRAALGTATAAPLGPGGVASLKVTGVGGVPASGVGAVVLNVTVTQPTANSYLAVYPKGEIGSTSSSLNFPRGWTGANSVTVAVGTDGFVDLYNSAGTAHVIVDVVGFYAGGGSAPPGVGLGGQFQPLPPLRLLDTRETSQRLSAGETAFVGLDFEEFNPHIRAYAVNITAVKPSGSGYLAAWNGVGTPPTTSTLNYTAGRVVPNFAIVPAAPCDLDPSCAGIPMIGVFAGGRSSVDILVDVVGVYDDSTIDGGLRFQPITPIRIADTRTGQGGNTTLGPNTTKIFYTSNTVAGPNTRALATNLTAVKPTANTYLTIWPTNLSRPTVSNVNPAKGQTVPNAAVTMLGYNSTFSIYNSAGSTNVLVDVVGVFEPGVTATYASPTAKPTLHYSPPRTEPLRATVATPIIR